MSTALAPQGKAMYVASDSDKNWLLNVQRKLYTRSWENPEYVFSKLWGFVTDSRNLRCALVRIARNKGKRTAGVDGITVRKILAIGPGIFIEQLKAELRRRGFKPSPVRRVKIPKPGKPGEFRNLGIPTVKDRVVATTSGLRGNIYGEPGAQRKVHAGFGGGGSGNRRVKTLYGAGVPIPILLKLEEQEWFFGIRRKRKKRIKRYRL